MKIWLTIFCIILLFSNTISKVGKGDVTSLKLTGDSNKLIAVAPISDTQRGLFFKKIYQYYVLNNDLSSNKQLTESITSSPEIENEYAFHTVSINSKFGVILGGKDFLNTYYLSSGANNLSSKKVDQNFTTISGGTSLSISGRSVLAVYGKYTGGSLTVKFLLLKLKIINEEITSDFEDEEESFLVDLAFSFLPKKNYINCDFNGDGFACAFLQNKNLYFGFISSDFSSISGKDNKVQADGQDINEVEDIKLIKLKEDLFTLCYISGTSSPGVFISIFETTGGQSYNLLKNQKLTQGVKSYYFEKKDEDSFYAFVVFDSSYSLYILRYLEGEILETKSNVSIPADSIMASYISPTVLDVFQTVGLDISVIQFFFPTCADLTYKCISNESVICSINEKVTMEVDFLIPEEESELSVRFSENQSSYKKGQKAELYAGNHNFIIVGGGSSDECHSKVCKLQVKACHSTCATCQEYSEDSGNPKCISCPSGFGMTPNKPGSCSAKSEKFEGYYFDDSANSFVRCYKSCKTCSRGGSYTEHNCETCKADYTLDKNKNCKCNSKYWYNEDKINGVDTCVDKCPSRLEYEIEDSKECVNDCPSGLKKYNKKCVSTCPPESKPNGNICEDDIKTDDILSVIEGADKNILKLYEKSPSKTFEKSDYMIYRMSSTPESGSRISLGDECERKIKEENGIPLEEDLLIFQVNFERDQLSKQVEYSVYSKDGRKLSMDPCKQNKIKVTTPLNPDADPSLNLTFAKEMEELGYDIFNPNDKFYTDFCTTYTTSNGTDVTLEDRKKYIYQNFSFCEEGCDYDDVDLIGLEITCSCSVKEEISEDESKFSFNTLGKEFTSIIKQTNIKVAKCYRLVFNTKTYPNNYGNWLILAMLLIQFAFLIVFLIFGIFPVTNPLGLIIEKKKENKKSIGKIEEGDESMDKKNDELIEPGLTTYPHSNPPKKAGVIQSSLVEVQSKIDFVRVSSTDQTRRTKLAGSMTDLIMLSPKESSDEKKTQRNSELKNDSGNVTQSENEEKVFTDEELDGMEYAEAVEKDKRNYFRQLWSQMKYSQSILFTFYTRTDYNLRSLKIILYFFGIQLMVGFNTLFYSDDTISHNYETGGKFEFVYSLPKTIIVNIVCDILTFCIEFLCLSRDGVQEIIEEEEKGEAQKKAKKFIKCWKKKICLFFILIFLFSFLFWYYISAFCAVYSNTQKHLLKDCLMSFVEEIIISFALIVLIVSIRALGLWCRVKWVFIVGVSLEKLHLLF